MKPIYYYNDTFQAHYWFFIGVTRQYFSDYMNKFYHISIDSMEQCKGKTIQLEHNGSIIQVLWVQDKKMLDVLVHECVHAANMTLYGVGLKADYDNDEIQAYLVQALFKQVIKKKKSVTKNKRK